MLIKNIVKILKNSFFLRKCSHWFGYYFIYGRALRKKLYGSKEVKLEKNAKRLFIPMIETNHYQYMQIMILGLAFKLRGYEVKVLVCDESLDGCEIKSVLNEKDSDPCWTCRFNRKKIVSKFGFNTISYKNLLDKSDTIEIIKQVEAYSLSNIKKIKSNGVDLTQSIEDSVTRYFYGALPGDNNEKKVRESHIKTALVNVLCASKINKNWKPDLVFTNMTAYSAWYPFYKFFEKIFFTISMSDYNFYGVTLNYHEVFLKRERFNNYLKSRNSSKLLTEEKIRLDNFIKNRISGKDELFIRDDCFDQDKNINEITKKYSIDESKRNVFLFSNLYWDVGLSEQVGLFEGVIPWVIKTVKIAEKDDDINLYVKTHPAENFGPAQSRKGISEIIHEEFPNGLTNTTIIEPGEKITPYSLFPFIDCAILFSGTLGFELLYSGIPVISVGSAAYNQLNLVSEPNTIDEYIEFIKYGSDRIIDRNKLELLAYFFFIKSIIPLDLTKSVYAAKVKDLFNIDSIEELKEGNNIYLDHLCNSMINPEVTIPEMWPDR
jgi:hypothetical protein